MFIQDVMYDEEHIARMIPAILDNYRNVFIPEVFEQRSVRNLPLFKLD